MAEAELQKKSFEEMRAEIDRIKQQNLARQNKTAPTTTGGPAIKFDTEGNELYKIWKDQRLSKEEKRQAFIKFMTIDESKTQEENAAVQKQISDFMFFLQRKRVALDRGKLLMEDPTTVALMDKLFKQMTGTVNEYADRFAKLDNYLTAIFNLRTAKEGNIQVAVAKEITTDIAAEEQRNADKAQLQAALKTLDVEIGKKKQEITKLENKKKFFFFKDDSPQTMEAIAQARSDLKDKEEEQKQKAGLLQDLNDTPVSGTAFPEYTAEKQIIREEQAKTFEQHVQQVQDMIKSLVKFIDDSCEGGDTLLASLEAQDGRIDDQTAEYKKLFRVSTTVVEASLEAAKANQAIADKYSDEKAPADELKSDAYERKDKLEKVQVFIDTANDFYQDTTEALASLTEEGIDLAAVKKNVTGLKREVSKRASSGIASVAGRLSAHVSHFQTAVAKESSETMQGAADALDEQTRLSNQSSAIQQANSYGEEAQQIQKMIEMERQKQELNAALSELKETGMGEIKEGVALLRAMIEQTQASLEKYKSVGTKMDMQDSKGTLTTEFDKNTERPAVNNNARKAKPGASRPQAGDVMPDL